MDFQIGVLFEENRNIYFITICRLNNDRSAHDDCHDDRNGRDDCNWDLTEQARHILSLGNPVTDKLNSSDLAISSLVVQLTYQVTFVASSNMVACLAASRTKVELLVAISNMAEFLDAYKVSLGTMAEFLATLLAALLVTVDTMAVFLVTYCYEPVVVEILVPKLVFLQLLVHLMDLYPLFSVYFIIISRI